MASIFRSQTFAVLAFATLLTTSAWSQEITPESKKVEVEAVVKKFVARASKLKIKNSAPEVKVQYTQAISSYFLSKTENSMTTTTVGQTPKPLQGMVNAWASIAKIKTADGKRELTGAEFFDELFGWFLIPHELGHYLQADKKPSLFEDRYESELWANRIAVAFLKEQRGNDARLARFGEGIARLADAIPNPVPAGADEKKYFGEHYEALVDSQVGYAWYQFKFMAKAVAERKKNPFDALVKVLLP